jgi:hypothetical protein
MLPLASRRKAVSPSLSHTTESRPISQITAELAPIRL